MAVSAVRRGEASIGHVSPEAAEGGPIALVREGDIIDIDINGGMLTLMVDEAELVRRKAQWKAPVPPITTGYLGRYARLVTSAASGAVFID